MGRISAVYADQRALPQIIEKPAEFFPAGLFADVIVTAHGLHQVAEPPSCFVISSLTAENELDLPAKVLV